MFVDKSQFTVLKVRSSVCPAVASPCTTREVRERGSHAMHHSLAHTTTQLYRDCLRLADYISTRGSQASRGSLRAQVRDAFRKNRGETDPVEIEKQKDAAIRGLSNYMFYEAQRMAKEGGEGGETHGGEKDG